MGFWRVAPNAGGWGSSSVVSMSCMGLGGGGLLMENLDSEIWGPDGGPRPNWQAFRLWARTDQN